MNKSERLKALLAGGYFPEELPPPFTTRDFAKYRSSIGKSWGAIPDYPKSTPEIYNVPRAKSRRRDLSIVNPVAQYYLSKLISDEWGVISNHLKNGGFGSEIPTIRSDTQRSVPTPDFSLIARRKAEIASRYNYALASDISRFYSTLYTHAIAWALETKSWCKINLNKPPYYASLGARIDQAVRKCNDNQTLGIPVGPDTSRIVSEIVVVCVDRLISAALGEMKNRVIRNVDDWFIGFDTLGRAEDAAAIIASACREYQLEAHPDKTEAKEMPWFDELSWPRTLNQIRFSTAQKKQKQDIGHFFSLAFEFSKQYPNDNILNYAIKVTRSSKIQPANWPEYETYLLRAARANHTTIPTVVQILTNYNADNFDIDKEKIGKLVEDLIHQCTPSGRHSEVAWALFLAKALKISLKPAIFDQIIGMDSSVCALLTLDLRSRNQISGPIDTSIWESYLTKDGLNTSMWLLAYEAKRKGWLTSNTPDYVDLHPHFSVLISKGITFYDPKKNVPHLIKNKKGLQSKIPEQPIGNLAAFLLNASAFDF